VRKLIRPGMAAVEVGTNCGFYSTLIADGIGPTGCYYGFDANPRMCDLARRSLEINGLRERAQVFNQAVSDQAGKLPFQIFANHMGGSTLLDVDKEFAEHLNDRVTTVEVESVRLDAALAALPAIDFLKIDAEGAEPRVLAGAEQLIGRSPMLTMILEFNPAMFSNLATARAYLGRLRKLGFRLRRITAEANCEEISEEVLLTRAHSELFLDRE
jgi:FkbM family methyltransferase